MMILNNLNDKNFLFLIAVLLVFLFIVSLFAQITITQSEFLQIFTAEIPFYVKAGESGLINVGSDGGPNDYDFTYVDLQNLTVFQNYSISQNPYLAARYPANATTIGQGPVLAPFIEDNPIFLSRNDSTFYAGKTTIGGEYRFVHYLPYVLFSSFPIQYGTNLEQWVQVWDTTYSLNWQVGLTYNYFNQELHEVDGYGTLKLNGLDLLCLRLKKEYPYYGYKEFFYLTREGVLFLVTDVSTSEPDTGYVNADYQVLFSESFVGIESNEPISSEFTLAQNYPNPFNPTTVISWQLATGSSIILSIYNLEGKRIEVLVDERQPAGLHSIEWNAAGYPSGVYFYRLETQQYVETRKMVFMK